MVKKGADKKFNNVHVVIIVILVLILVFAVGSYFYLDNSYDVRLGPKQTSCRDGQTRCTSDHHYQICSKGAWYEPTPGTIDLNECPYKCIDRSGTLDNDFCDDFTNRDDCNEAGYCVRSDGFRSSPCFELSGSGDEDALQCLSTEYGTGTAIAFCQWQDSICKWV